MCFSVTTLNDLMDEYSATTVNNETNVYFCEHIPRLKVDVEVTI